MGNPLTQRIEQITKQSDEPNWRSQKWEKPIQEDESPSFTPRNKISIKIDKGGKKLKKKKNFERNYCNKVHQKRTEQEPNQPFLKRRRYNNRTMKPDPEPLLSRRNKDQGNFQRRITLRKTELPDLTKSKLKLNRPPLTGDNDDRTKGNFL